jgi:transcriptional repressor NrdR
MPSVVKRNGSRHDYEASKLRASLSLALRKRPISTEDVDAVVMRIEDKLLTSGEREVSTEFLGELVMAELKKLDKVAYVRFASVYKSFEDIGEFVEAIREMQGPPLRRKT